MDQGAEIAGVGAAVVPVGGITAFAGAAAPTGWLLCNGAAVSRTQYGALFAVIGITYGAGDGSTTFNVPNAKGAIFVGSDASVAAFDTLGETGGSRDSASIIHTHTSIAHGHSFASSSTHSHSFTGEFVTVNTGDAAHSHVINSKVRTTNTAHAHDHDEPQYSVSATGAGTTFGASNVTTDNQASGHAHGTNSHSHNFANDGIHSHNFVNNSVTISTDGSSGIGANLQPYQVINYIIKW